MTSLAGLFMQASLAQCEQADNVDTPARLQKHHESPSADRYMRDEQ
jgi:hypothetical protein